MYHKVAAKANTHLKVYKETIDQRIQTFVESLDEDARIKEIAAMLSDETMSTFAIEQAKMLLKQKRQALSLSTNNRNDET